MNELQKKLNECKTCPFEDYDINWYDEKTGCGKLAAHWEEGAKPEILVVGQNPSHRRYVGTHAFNGHQGDPFRKVFGIENLAFTNFVQISTPDNKVDQLNDNEVMHCFKHLLNEIEYLKPKNVIFCGKFIEKKMFDLQLYKYIENVKYVFVKHPDFYLSYHKGDVNEYINILEKIKTCI